MRPGSRALPVHLLQGAWLRAQQVPHRPDVAVPGGPKNVQVASARGSKATAAAHVAGLAVHVGAP